jgi:hypothetical protein
MSDLDFILHSLGVILPICDNQEKATILFEVLQSSHAVKARDNEFAYYLSIEPEALMTLMDGEGNAFEWKLGFLMYLQGLSQGTWVDILMSHLTEVCLLLKLKTPT